MDQFHQSIRRAILDQNLQAALDANAERRVKGRIAAFATLDDPQERRQRAHGVRAEVIEHLQAYLDQFTQHVRSNGITVHRARDAAEAVDIILEIAGRAKDKDTAGPTLFAKSKSMVSEEIGLNHALEAAGHRVVETDLGEYIVQLRGEKPAHIITPAVHLRRNDVGELFHQKLGIPYTEDIPTLTNTARRVLRKVFLSADIGVSGVNFGVAETGGLCIVTNEGNGRMITTLPRVHIALMGMERLVRTFDDLALMISLLPRSATGQKISVYTQILHRPLEGQQRHLIVLDNGRSRLRDSPLRESLYCIRCGACLNACPVFREIGGHAYHSVYPGPIGSVISSTLFGPEHASLAQASSLCGACREACPVDIDLPKLLIRVRAGASSPRTPAGQGLGRWLKLGLGLYSRIARSPRLFGLSQRLSALITHLLSPSAHMIHIPAFTGWGYSKDFPRFANRPFRQRFAGNPPALGRPGTQAAVVRPAVPPTSTSPVSTPSGLLDRFCRELTALGGFVTLTNDPTRAVIELLQSRGIERIHLEPGVLDEPALSEAGIQASRMPDPQIRAGVTKAICSIAETGSVLVTDGEGHPLHASLLPETHLVVIRASSIVPSLGQALPFVEGTRAAVFITGPSRTGDIEMTLTIGVHGPGELHVFLIDDLQAG